MISHRTFGILLPISSLHSSYGFGNIGQSSFEFIDFLSESGSKIWQICPIGHITEQNSPYICYSSFAGNPYFIDLKNLQKEGLIDSKIKLTKNELNFIDYDTTKKNIDNLLLQASALFHNKKLPTSYLKFIKDNNWWLEDYATFMTIFDQYQTDFSNWPKKLKHRDKKEIHIFQKENLSKINYYKFIQYKFFSQWEQLKAYSHKKGIRILGDIPIFHNYNSVETWTNPNEYYLDNDLKPTHVAGVPPDYFSKTGQLWGNPLYNFHKMKKNSYQFWRKVFSYLAKMYDITRIDHFRGFEAYYKIPFPAKDATKGKWEKGPDKDLFDLVLKDHPTLPFVVEDLGVITKEVIALKNRYNFMGMHILQFGLESMDSDMLPFSFSTNSITYTGTHDNDTLIGWFESKDKKTQSRILKYLQCNHKKQLANNAIIEALKSPSLLTVVPLQDFLEVGSIGRINTPGSFDKIYTYKIKKSDLNIKLALKIKDLLTVYKRI